ncbi:hypothetical protein QBC34DRAFT_384284 [Podospora aff. communis PSN243]|uniref:BTB domain-containing protein n=1 Tax=Podospora aff. communis PSN243 TaxID=3040156 RepID=A0AAV9GC28_9PEZI|nr:hypothetical protein QBC34DRAFT_384284 [Podospora aff. communis PSN243]
MTLQLARDAALERKPLSYEDIATSKPFLFTIGPNRREFTLPSILVAAQSPVLDRLVNGEFNEAQCRESRLEDIEEETFIRFIEYAYTGSYGDADNQLKAVVGAYPTPSKPVSMRDPWSSSLAALADSPAEEAPLAVEDDHWGFAVARSSKKVKKGKKGESSNALSIVATPQIPANPAMFQPLGKTFDNEVCSLKVTGASPVIAHRPGNSAANPFVAHARVFVFADYWGITSLRNLSLQALAAELKAATPENVGVRDKIVELVEYCFEDVRPEELVKLAVRYAAFRLPHLWSSNKFQGIFADNKDLSMGLVGNIVQAAISG